MRYRINNKEKEGLSGLFSVHKNGPKNLFGLLVPR